MRFNLEDDDMEATLPRTEDSAERGLVHQQTSAHDPVTYRDLGKAEELDQEDVGDIADEGLGHRG